VEAATVELAATAVEAFAAATVEALGIGRRGERGGAESDDRSESEKAGLEVHGYLLRG
jgi:hypothetical protein